MSLLRRCRPWIRNSPARLDCNRVHARLRPLCLVVLLVCAALPAGAADRVALVIGNGSYAHVRSLPNPENDAADISAALEDLGFAVLSARDAPRDAMDALVREFAGLAAESDVALFYFAGHAFQVGGRNYLVPTDLDPAAGGSVLDQSFSLDTVMAALEAAPGLKFVFLDSCRDNPLGLSEAAGGSGLARTGSSADFLIAYATQPGAVAFDGDGRNGTFTEAVLNHIHIPGQNVGEMMIAVRRDVIAATGGQQVPWENSSLTREFEFDPGKRTVSNETLLYQIAARTRSTELMSLYLDRYPRGAHAADAQSFLMAARGDQPTQGRNLPEDADLSEDGTRLWQLVQRTRLRELAEFYLRHFPQGPHSGEAWRLLETQPSEWQLGPGRLCERMATHPRDATATLPGVEFEQLRQNADLAIETCRAAVESFPEQPRYTALLARATIAAGDVDEAVTLYRDAAERGDLRAMVSLGLLTEAGNGVPKDPRAAIRLYERAAEHGSADGAINYAVALYQGSLVPQDVDRAIGLFRRASEAGSAIATFNLGVLAQNGTAGTSAEALRLFLKAARGGEPRGYRAAAVLLDEGRGVDQDETRAASLLLRGAAEDRGEIITGLEGGQDRWSEDTIRKMQSILAKAGCYEGNFDGVAGPGVVTALKCWRAGAFDASLLAG
jgi:uncharacterized caspase-like protein